MDASTYIQNRWQSKYSSECSSCQILVGEAAFGNRLGQVQSHSSCICEQQQK